jgi:N-methylhydantoinase A
MPGPACYNRGGIQPTVTDANLVLGRLNPDNFNAGYMKLNQNNAKKAIEKYISKPLQLSVEEAASAIIYTVNANMIAAIKVITVERGIDPRNYVLFCGGGAGSLHAISLAEGLNINRILIPKVAGAISATGGLYSNVVSEFSTSYYIESRSFDFEKINELLSALYEKADAFLERQGIDKYSRKYHLYIEGRYPNQVWEIPVRIDNLLVKRQINNEVLKKIINKFNDEHEKLYSIKEDTYIEFITWRVTAIGSRKELSNKEIIKASIKTNESAEHAAKYTSRKVFFKALSGMVDTPIYDGLKLKFGHEIVGPAIIEEPTTTILLRHNYHLRVTPFNNYFIRKIN